MSHKWLAPKAPDDRGRKAEAGVGHRRQTPCTNILFSVSRSVSRIAGKLLFLSGMSRPQRFPREWREPQGSNSALYPYGLSFAERLCYLDSRKSLIGLLALNSSKNLIEEGSLVLFVLEAPQRIDCIRITLPNK